MSLWTRLHINTHTIGVLDIQRREHHDGTPPADSVNSYTVSLDDEEIGLVWHTYGHGPWVLLSKAAMLAASR